MAELRARRDRVTNADLIELRVDTVSDPSAAAALAGRRQPVIFTCRAQWEGGYFTGSEEERKRILLEAQQLRADYVDVEWRAGFEDVINARGGQGVVLSMHDFDGVPADLVARAVAMRSTGAEVVKIAVTPSRLVDNLRLMPIANAAVSPTVVIGMGDAGLATRVLAARFGSCWTYAGDGAAPGQIPGSVLCGQYGFRTITARTPVYGVVGRPVAHSLSPAIHNAAFRTTGTSGVYLPLAAADFDDFLTFAAAFEIEGASVTAPFKVEAFERAAESDPVGRRIQAVNTLRRRGQRWEGCNTDVEGFLAPLRDRLALDGVRATVLGAGGAARAVGEALASARAIVTFSARRGDAAERVARLTGAQVGAYPPERGSWDLLVNTTPIGTAPDLNDTPVPASALDGRLVYDLVYNPIETALLRDARRAGCETLGGLDMLIAQAQRQFEWWTGRRAPERAMREAAISTLAERASIPPETWTPPSARNL
jgi:3-dehydroquinate dehydratase/shikimate dehydrogenase